MGAAGVRGQEPTRPTKVTIPETATVLEGVPTVRVDSSSQGITRRVLGKVEAADNRLTIRVHDGQLFWASRNNDLLRIDTAGEYTYLSSAPGRYIKFTRLNDRISYVEHLDQKDFGSITYWGELRIVVGK